MIWNNTVTLYIDDAGIRLMVSQGQKVKAWGEMKLEPGLVKGAVVAKEEEVAAKIRELLKNEKVSAKKVLLGFSGIHSLTRPVTLPDLPKAMLPEAIAREARRVLPVPLDQLYLSWRLIPSPKGRTQVFMAATPRKTADSLIKTLQLAGLEARHMTIKPLILTKTLTTDTAILIDLQPDEFDIVIISEGVMQPIRTINLPDAELSPDQKLETIISDLQRTIQFFDTNNPEKPLAPIVPIFVSGDLAGQAELCKTLSEAVKHPVSELASVFKGIEESEQHRYLVNMAMAAPTHAYAKENSFSVANLNLLPAPYQPKPISTFKLVVIPSSAAVIGLIVPMVMLIQNGAANIASMQSELEQVNAAANQKLARQQELKGEIAGLEKQTARAKLIYDNLQVSVKKLATDQEMINGDLTIALSLAPASVTVMGINASGGSLVINGASLEEKDILAYARELDKSGRFKNTTITSLTRTPGTEEAPDGSANFTITLTRGG